MKITLKFLKENDACSEGIAWFKSQKETDGIKLVETLIDHDWSWANWLITRIMTHPQYLAYAIFAAEQVIEIYEKRNPNNDKPRKAIEAAKAVLANDTKETRAYGAAATDAAAYAAVTTAAAAAAYAATDAAADAAAAAYAATDAAAAAYAAAAAAAYAAAAAAYAATDAAYAAYAATDAAAYAATDAAAYAAAYAAKEKMRLKIISYGLELLKEKVEIERRKETK